MGNEDSKTDTLSVCVLDADAATYTDLLEGANIAVGGPEAPIWLAQPDRAAKALNEHSRRPQWIQSTWAGVRPLIDIAAEQNLTVTGLKDIFAPLISEYVFARLLARTTRVADYRQAQNDRQWLPTWPDTLAGKRLCVVGTGSIGSHLATTARHFGMSTVGVSRTGRARPDFDEVFSAAAIRTAVAEVDVIVATLPDTDATRRIIDASVFAACAPNAWFFNVGRAATVDHEALVAALAAGQLARATIDLTPTEPLPSDDSLWRVANLEITPHIAAVSHPHDVVAKFLANLQRFREGVDLVDRIDLRAGY